MTWLVVVCGIANVFIGVWIGWTRAWSRAFEAGRRYERQEALRREAAYLAVRATRRRRWERDRVEPEEEDDNDRI